MIFFTHIAGISTAARKGPSVFSIILFFLSQIPSSGLPAPKFVLHNSSPWQTIPYKTLSPAPSKLSGSARRSRSCGARCSHSIRSARGFEGPRYMLRRPLCSRARLARVGGSNQVLGGAAAIVIPPLGTPPMTAPIQRSIPVRGRVGILIMNAFLCRDLKPLFGCSGFPFGPSAFCVNKKCQVFHIPGRGVNPVSEHIFFPGADYYCMPCRLPARFHTPRRNIFSFQTRFRQGAANTRSNGLRLCRRVLHHTSRHPRSSSFFPRLAVCQRRLAPQC